MADRSARSQAWRERTVHAFEIVAELVAAVAMPSPDNPFELQQGAIEELPLVEGVMLSGSVASFLRELYLSQAPYSKLVEADLLYAIRLHYGKLPRLASLPEVRSRLGGAAAAAAPPRPTTQPGVGRQESPQTPYVPRHPDGGQSAAPRSSGSGAAHGAASPGPGSPAAGQQRTVVRPPQPSGLRYSSARNS